MYKRYKYLFILPLFVLIVFSSCGSKESIQNFQVKFGIVKVGNEKLIVLRQFVNGEREKFLCVHPESLKTTILNKSDGEFEELLWPQVKSRFTESPFIRTLNHASKNVTQLQDAGVTHALPTERGINLTIDLCPSKRKLDKAIFTTIINELNKVERPTPIALAVSGLWIKYHQDDLQWIKDLIKEGKISVEWINHSFSHKYNKNYPLRENFLLEKGTDLNYEVLGNEITMLENGLTPSVLFRFPGLVSDSKLLNKISEYGLISVGTDAWLAKGQKAKQGSIVLIHGNGNEPIGVNDFIKLIQSEGNNIKNKNWLLFDLTESIREEEKLD